MLQKVQTKQGECWAIVLNPNATLEDIHNYQNGLIYVLQAVTSCDTFNTAGADIYWLLEMLQNTMPTEEQMSEFEKITRQKK